MEQRTLRIQRLRGHTGGEFDPDFILDSKGVESADSENSLKRASGGNLRPLSCLVDVKCGG